MAPEVKLGPEVAQTRRHVLEAKAVSRVFHPLFPLRVEFKLKLRRQPAVWHLAVSQTVPSQGTACVSNFGYLGTILSCPS